MSHHLPDLSQPYGSENERFTERYALVFTWNAIELLLRLAEQPIDQWTSDQVDFFPRSVPGGPPETPQQRLQRWLTVYGDEIRTVRDLRNRIAHGIAIADSEIRGGLYLARNVIASAVGTQPSEAESAARRVLALAS